MGSTVRYVYLVLHGHTNRKMIGNGFNSVDVDAVCLAIFLFKSHVREGKGVVMHTYTVHTATTL